MILTVVIAAKDAPQSLMDCCLASLARLNRARDLEIVIVNSGVFPEPCARFGSSFHAFRRVEMAPKGVYAAYNRGIAEASGRYLLFFGVDDIALPGMDSVIGTLEQSSPVYDLYAATAYMQGIGMSKPARARTAILFRNWCHQGLFYSREYLVKHPFDLDYAIQADHKANIEILADRSLRIGRSSELVSYFATGGASQTAHDLRFRRDLPRIAGENFGPAYRLTVALKQRIANVVKGSPVARR